ncbi:hypothetical protein [Fibrivirga algicola]|uniref:Uncharacterized protein n=1 Tax=Fibrivirga algicola TaxID=2950420 RepID=A0ABX0QHE6_9BACT|nr:hypothetical protein [Fibrivirga algicola]NID11551.1 hypothetical protein [Fibrivirga algicola]
MRVINRAQKLALLQSLVNGTTTAAQLDTLRQLQEPIHITLNLSEDEQAVPADPSEPTYHIDCFSNGITRKYYRYPDGSVEPA